LLHSLLYGIPELLHIAPVAGIKDNNVVGASSQPSDIYAIGCIAYQIFFREALYNELDEGEHVDHKGTIETAIIGATLCTVEIVVQMLSGQKQRAPLNWTLRNGVVHSDMFEVMTECCTFNASARPNIRHVKSAVHATADKLCVD
jgi:hypothetical protein